MVVDLTLHQRRRTPTSDELRGIPWLALLKPEERFLLVERQFGGVEFFGFGLAVLQHLGRHQRARMARRRLHRRLRIDIWQTTETPRRKFLVPSIGSITQ